MHVLVGRSLIRLEALEGDGSGNHGEGELVGDNLSGVDATSIGNIEAERKVARRKVGVLKDIREGNGGTRNKRASS